MESLHPETVTDLSLELESLVGRYTPAAKGRRFADLLIDTLAIYVINAIVAVPLEPALSYGQIGHPEATNVLFFWEGTLLWSLMTCLYYGFMERFCGGRTLGKFCTNTKAVGYPGQEPLSFKKALTRALCRLVPFEALSGFGVPWHDRWTHTMVVRIKDF